MALPATLPPPSSRHAKYLAPLRAGATAKLSRDPELAEARAYGVAAIRATADAAGLPNRVLGRDDERDGARIRSGAKPVCVGHFFLLLPLLLVVSVVVALLSKRLRREAEVATGEDALRIRLAMTHLAALEALFPGSH